MRVHVADHPLVTHKLTVLRDKTTPSPTFRLLAEELVTLLAYEATRNVRVEEVTVRDAGLGARRARDQPAPAARGADPPRRARDARRHGEAHPDRRGGIPRHGARRGDAAAVGVRRTPAGGPRGPADLHPGPHAGDRRLAHRRHRLPLRHAAPTT